MTTPDQVQQTPRFAVGLLSDLEKSRYIFSKQRITGEQNCFSTSQTISSVKNKTRQEHVAGSSLPISPKFS